MIDGLQRILKCEIEKRILLLCFKQESFLLASPSSLTSQVLLILSSIHWMLVPICKLTFDASWINIVQMGQHFWKGLSHSTCIILYGFGILVLFVDSWVIMLDRGSSPLEDGLLVTEGRQWGMSTLF